MKASYNALIDIIFTNEQAELITLSDVKNWLKLDLNDDDSLLITIITAARIQVENVINLSLISRTIKATIINGLGNFLLPYGPVTTITTVQDMLGNLVPNAYIGNIIYEAFEHTAIVTYDVQVTAIRPNIKLALLQQCAFLYEHRGDGSANGISPIVLNNLKSIRRL